MDGPCEPTPFLSTNNILALSWLTEESPALRTQILYELVPVLMFSHPLPSLLPFPPSTRVLLWPSWV